MGVGQEKKDVFFGPYVQENEMHVLESQSHESGQSTDEEDIHPPTAMTTRSPRHRNRLRPRSSSLEACLTGMYRRCGAKQARRTENIKFLLSMKVDGDEETETMRSPSYNHHFNSGFSALFHEKEKMKAWNDFVNSSEEDQERILAMRTAAVSLGSIEEVSDEEVSDEEVSDEEDDNCNLGQDCDDSWQKVTYTLSMDDKRAVHPSFSAKECFERLDKNLRAIVTRRHMPLGILEQLEREVVDFFKDCSGSVYVSHITSSFERLLLHAVCQYLGLHCRSYEENGQRRTQVENRSPTLQIPTQTLCDYLQHIS